MVPSLRDVEGPLQGITYNKNNMAAAQVGASALHAARSSLRVLVGAQAIHAELLDNVNVDLHQYLPYCPVSTFNIQSGNVPLDKALR
jgi:hypothetical protein